MERLKKTSSFVGTNTSDISVTFVFLVLCVVSSLCTGSTVQPKAQGVVPYHRVAQHTRTQGPLLLFLLPAFLFLLILIILSLLSRLSPLLSCRGSIDLPPLLCVAVGDRSLLVVLVVGAYGHKVQSGNLLGEH